MDAEQHLPSGQSVIDGKNFNFHCYPGVPCFLSCCRNVDMLLFPYDIVRLKQRLNINSSDFIRQHTQLCAGSHSHFPGLKLKLTEEALPSCPFLDPQGCRVYEDRPSACRTYPLERGVEQPGPGKPLQIHYFMTNHSYCKGHLESHTYSLKQWERDQRLYDYNLYNDLWAELDAFFATNPWGGEGKAGPYQQLAFMVCYNIDGFRDYVERHKILNTVRLTKDERRRIANSDEQLLRFGFVWLEFLLGGRKNLLAK